MPDKFVHESASERDTQVQNFKKDLIEEIKNQGLNGIGLEFSTVQPENTTAEESPKEDTSITLVKWINKHSEWHTVTASSPAGLWDSGSLSQGASYSFQFNETGKYQFICQLHDDMRATVTVTDQE